MTTSRVGKKFAVLPPLKASPEPNQTTRKTDTKKMLNLVTKAITSISLREKNEILEEVRNLWMPQCGELEDQLSCNSVKEKELVFLHKKNDDFLNQCEILKRNTAFYEKANVVRTRHDENKLKSSIKELENEIKVIKKLNAPDKLNEALSIKDDSDQRLFTLVDLNISRLEEQAYAYKKRLIAVEQSQESIEGVMQKYGSVNKLIERVQELENENALLIENEKKFLSDAFTKRRKFSEISPIISRKMVSVFDSMIEAENSTLESYQQQNFKVSEINDPDLFDFGKICMDPQFDVPPEQFETAEFGNSTDMQEIDALVAADNTRQKVQILKSLCNQLAQLNNKIHEEILSLREKKTIMKDVTHSRVDKMNEESERLFQRIVKANAALDDRFEECSNLSRQLQSMIKYKKSYSLYFVDVFANYRDLVASHVSLIHRHFIHCHNLRSLLLISDAMGLSLLNKEKDKLPITPMYNYFYLTMKQIQSILELERPTPPPIPEEATEKAEESQETSFANPLSMAEMLKKQKNRHKRSHVDKIKTNRTSNTSTSHTSATTSTTQINVLSDIDKRPPQIELLSSMAHRVEIYNAISFANDLAGFIIGHDRRFYSWVHQSLLSLLSNLDKASRQQINEVGEEMKSNISTIRICSNNILVKAKETIQIQTDPESRIDIELQTNETGIGAKRKK